MRATSDEQAVIERFSSQYELLQSEVMLGIERSVCGCDYGATSWTTFDEARTVAGLLALTPGKRLLDVGSGSGWPGIFLARETGCDVTLADLPLSGLRIAMKRAAADGVAGTCRAAVADGAALPFRSGCFDAIFHSDVLCCLVRKLDVLRSCRRVVRAGGKMAFSVILITPGLSAADHGRAADCGPPFVATETPYPEMFAQCGWDITDHLDLTGDYRATVGLMLDQLETHADAIGDIFGDAAAAQERDRRRATLAALDRGLLRRQLFVAVPSAGGN
jgi:cyclopropane fatty-acyl-phospholipid synthase-like methyltransferase